MLATATVPDLVPGPGEVIIAVSVADVLLLDTAIRSGRAAAWFPITRPMCPATAWPGRSARWARESTQAGPGGP